MEHQEPRDGAAGGQPQQPQPPTPPAGFGPPPPGYGPPSTPPGYSATAAQPAYQPADPAYQPTAPAYQPLDPAYQPTAPVKAEPAPAPRPSRRNLLVGLAAGGVVLAGGGAAWAVLGSKPKPSPNPAPPHGAGTASPSAGASASAGAGRAAGQPPKALWTFEAPGTIQPYLAAAAGTLLVVGSEVTALDPANGRQKWDFRKLNPLLGSATVSPVALGRTQVVVSSGDIFNPALTCLDLATGGTVWDTTAPPTLVVSQFLGYDDKILYVLAKLAPNGAKWSDLPGNTEGEPVVAALDCVNHKIVWTLPRQKGAKDNLPLLITDTRFIYTDEKGSLVVRDIATGKQLWSAGDGGDGAVSGLPVIIGDTIFAGDPETVDGGKLRKGYVRAFDLATGAPKYQGRTWGDLLVPELAAADGQLYLWSPSQIAAADPVTGAAKWTRKSDATGITNSGVRIAGPTVFAWPEPTDNPTVTAIDRATGTDRWTYRADLQPESGALWNSASDNDRLYLSVGSHVLALPAV